MAATTATAFDRDKLANWYAKRHFAIDSGVERIFYLPTNAPARDIRFLEVNRLVPELTNPEPIDFGVDADGADSHTLLVLDVTPSQWEAISTHQMPLPPGWTLDGAQSFSRG
jgi:hypothetical protein